MEEKDTDRMGAPDSGVRIRMYNPGFGDCFLLAFRGAAGEPVYVLIDCGVHGSYRDGSKLIGEVLKDIREATGSRIHLVVVTHEHADHVSGFYLGREIFNGGGDPEKGIQVEQVWFAWTEDPNNEQAQRLDKAKKLMLQGLLLGSQGLGADRMDSMLGFYAMPGLAAGDGTLPLGGSLLGVSTREARDEIRNHARSCRYLKPKIAPLPIPGVDEVRVFVLGPPEDEKALLSPDPTGAQGEVYEEEGGHPMRLLGEESLVAALGARGGLPTGAMTLVGDPPAAWSHQPFASNHRLPLDSVRARKDLYPFFHQHYGFEGATSGGSPEGSGKAGAELEPSKGRNPSVGATPDPDRPSTSSDPSDSQAWRRIDEDWLRSTESLALKLDSATNNTSLVLAIELPQTKRVLLFAGDAQVGNWKSWHDGGWTQKNGLGPGEEITAEDLLNRTVLYKVGHHGSHNATLRAQGLEMMTSDELIALIPVDQEWAEARKPHPWMMPFAPMYKDLETRTRGRIVRCDAEVAPAGDAWKPFPGKEPTPFDSQLRPGKNLYFELDIPDE